MILSSPFSRQNRAHQTWLGNNHHHHHHHGHHTPTPNQSSPHHQPAVNSLARKPAPRQSAPVCPPTVPPLARDCNGYRSLNRLDMLKRRQQQQHQHRQRNLSSLGHYPAAPSPSLVPAHKLRPSQPPEQQIYAPASIASPSEYYQRRPGELGELANDQSQHYAATSCAPSESGYRSGRDSALGQLMDKFDTLRRRARLSRLLSSSRKTLGRATSTASPSAATWSNSRSSSAYHSNGCSTPSAGSVANFKSSQQAAGNIPAGASLDSNNNNADSAPGSGARKRLEADEIYAEGWRAINENGQKRLLEHQLDASLMLEGETRTLILYESRQLPEYQQLVAMLTNWINDELAEQRIIVRDLLEDLHDGQVLCRLLEKLAQLKLDVVEVTQNELTQKYKLRACLETINRILTKQTSWARVRWSVEGIHSKNMVEILQLLVALALFYRAPCKLPPSVQVQALVVQKHQARLIERTQLIQLTGPSGATSFAGQQLSTGLAPQGLQRDAFDTLIEHAPEKLAIVGSALVKFAERHLNKINMTCRPLKTAEHSTTLDNNNNNNNTHSGISGLQLDPDQFSDGLLLVFLISSLEDYFVPLGNLFTASKTSRAESRAQAARDEDPFANHRNLPAYQHTFAAARAIETDLDDPSVLQTAIEPTNFVNTQPIEKLHNVNVALQLIEDAGVEIKRRVRAEDIANGDLKAVLRVLYALFSRYKHV